MAIVLAFSGGLDTSFCVPYLAETCDEPIYTVTVNTGGLSEKEAQVVEARARALGAARHILVDARRTLFDDHLSYLIKGNVLRGGVYPLCVGPERVTQARMVVHAAQETGARAIAHGSTGAGNDQVRFDVAVRLLADNLDILTPIRSLGLSREETTAFLQERGFDVPRKTTVWSINRGLWGATIGGGETLTSANPLPEEGWADTVAPANAPDAGQEWIIGFETGLPVSINESPLDPVTLVETLNAEGAAHGVGRGMHVGDTILGVKGRVAFEAPAPAILLPAHRELEKVVLTNRQRFQKDHLADYYGQMLHEGQYFDPVMRDIEALIDSSQTAVTGAVRVKARQGCIEILGCESPYSMFDPSVAVYGETNALWDGRDAEGFTQIYGVQALLAHRARRNAENASQESPA